jgi:hypothetical protein
MPEAAFAPLNKSGQDLRIPIHESDYRLSRACLKLIRSCGGRRVAPHSQLAIAILGLAYLCADRKITFRLTLGRKTRKRS